MVCLAGLCLSWSLRAAAQPPAEELFTEATDIDPDALLKAAERWVSGPSAGDLRVGDRVRRGADWKWEEQDGGDGRLGTVVRAPTATGWARVDWDAGGGNDYRWGHSGAYDLARLDGPHRPEAGASDGLAASSVSVPDQIRAARGMPGEGDWDGEIKTILVSAYDSDASGVIDRPAELEAIPCAVFVTLESQFAGSSSFSSPMRTVYGFPSHLGWVGDSIGFDASVRAPADAHWAGCVPEEAPAPAVAPLPVGTRVKRGPDWKWDEQDGGAGELGTVVTAPTRDEWARVEWDAGGANTYRWGHAGAYDLELAGVPVAASKRRQRRPARRGSVPDQIRAARGTPGDGDWDEEIMTILVSAYDSDGSGLIDRPAELEAIPCAVFVTLESQFTRWSTFSSPMRRVYGFPSGLAWVGDSIGFDVSVQAAADARWTSCVPEAAPAPPLESLPVGTRVKRGPDWKWDEQDGGAGELGTVVRAPTRDEWARVEWDLGGANTYRWGHAGAYDLELVGVPVPGLQVGDRVRIVDVSSEDAYFDDRQAHIGVVCTVEESLTMKEGGWIGGQLSACSHGLDPYFYKARLEKVDGAGE